MSGQQVPQQPDAEVVRSEEELAVGVEEREAGKVRARRSVEHEHVTETVDRAVEHAEVERAPADEDDEGDLRTLDDGSISIPVFEERLVVEKRRVVRERVVVRKRPIVEQQAVEADLARERVEITADPEVEGRVRVEDPADRSGS